MHGYSIAPYLPLILKKMENRNTYMQYLAKNFYTSQNIYKRRIFEDYLNTKQLFMTRVLLQLKLDKSLNIKLRLQAHGGYGNYLDAYGIADIPESEVFLPEKF